MKPYPLIDDLVRPVLRVGMPRAPRVIAPGGTMHVVARCKNQEFYFPSAEDFDLLLAHLRELVRTYEVTVYAYALMSNHVHVLLQAPTHEALGRPLRWFLTETARAFHKLRGRRGHFGSDAIGRVSSRRTPTPSPRFGTSTGIRSARGS